MLGLRTEVFAQRIHRNVLGCVPITKELESAEVLETTHEKAKFLGKHWMRINTNLVCPLSERRAPGFKGCKPLSGRKNIPNSEAPPLPAIWGNWFVSA